MRIKKMLANVCAAMKGRRLSRKDNPQMTTQDRDNVEPKATAPRRTLDQLDAAIRDKCNGARIAFDPAMELSQLRLLLPRVENALDYGASVLATLRRVHQIGQLGEDAYVREGGDVTSVITRAFPVAEVHEWTGVVIDGEPAYEAVIRFASDPIAPRVRVSFTVAFRKSVDGTENLIYLLKEVSEDEAQDPHGT